MRLEHIPLILGAIVALIGLGFIADASMAATTPPSPERRRRTRAEPSRAGEAVVGIGTLCMAAALFGRDTWRYGTLCVLVGGALLLIGIVLNRAFLKEALLFRGPARRAEGGSGGESGKGKGARPAGRADAGRQPTTPPARPPQSAPPPQKSPPRQPPPREVRPPEVPRAEPLGRSPAATGATAGRHPTPLGSPVYRPVTKPADATPPPTPQAHQQPQSPTPPPTPPATQRPTQPPTPPPSQPPGPKERRKTPRGKR